MIYELSNIELGQYIKTYKRRNLITSLDDNKCEKIYLNNIPKRKIELLRYLSNYGVICGSMALKLYGVLQRDVNDIDLVCTDASYTYLKTIHKKYSDVNHYFSFSALAKYHVDCLAIKKFNLSSFKVDIFIKDTDIYNDYDGIKLQPLNDIINEKSILMRTKDVEDLKEILARIENNQYIIKTKRSIFRKIFEPFYTAI